MHLVVLFLSIIIGLADIFVIISYASPKYEMIWLLPYAFCVFSIVFSQAYRLLGKSVVASLLWGVMFLKNIITPFFIALGKGSYFVIADTTEYIIYAYFLEIYELLIVFWCINKASQSFLSITKNQNNMVIDKRVVNFIFKSTFCIILLFVVVVILYPQLLSFYAFEILISENDKIAQSQISHQIRASTPVLPFYLFNFLFNWLRWLLPLSILLKIYIANTIRGFLAVTLSLIIILFSVVNLSTDERADSIYILIPFSLILVKMYPTYKKGLYTLLGGVFSLVGIMGLILKSYGDNMNSIDFQDIANLLQAYFSGPDNVAVGLMLPFPTLEILFGDIFKHIPYVMYFFKDLDNSMIQFNYFFFNKPNITTQIIPMISQGQRYFTFIGAPIFTYILCCLAFKFEKKAHSMKSFLYYCMDMILCSFLPFAIVMYCISQCIAIYISAFLPTILLVKYALRRYRK